VPKANILALPLGKDSPETIGRADYDRKLAGPVRRKLAEPEFAMKINCLLTTYGVPIKVQGRGPLQDKQAELKQTEQAVEIEKNKLRQLEQDDSADLAGQKNQLQRNLARLRSDVDRLKGKETGASVDSELSMVLAGDYELYRWQPNLLRNNMMGISLSTLMVCRLDGPSYLDIRALVDKAITAEKTGLKGVACIDSRGLIDDKKPYSLGYFDKSLRDLAVLTELRSGLSVRQEQTEELFAAGSCPRTAIYCGWYSLGKYVDAFDFVDGAIGFHIASLEAVNLRDPKSEQWCAAMLTDGITATLGAVAEPYVHAFPEPSAFFLELFNGRSLVDAYYYTKPFNSWQLVLIGDPLYRPFKATD
jgi:uncharacterized protein (TIGR03790 family)